MTLNAILKYPWQRQTTGYAYKKYGAYGTESEEFEFARYGQVTTRRRSVEAEIMDWADDVTYALDDLEDFVHARLIPMERLAHYSDDFVNGVNARLESSGLRKFSSQDVATAAKGLFSLYPLQKQFDGSTADTIMLRTFLRILRRRYLTGLQLNRPADDREQFVYREPQLELEIAILKELMWHFVIEGPALATMQYGLRRILADLFEILLHDAMDRGTILPPRVREAIPGQTAAGRTAMQLARPLPTGFLVSAKWS